MGKLYVGTIIFQSVDIDLFAKAVAEIGCIVKTFALFPLYTVTVFTLACTV